MKFSFTCARRALLFCALLGCATAIAPPQARAQGQSATPLYKDAKAPLEARVNDLLGRLTLDEKISLLSGTGFATPAIPRLGVPPLEMADAGQGVRGGDKPTQGPATAFPSGVAMASTWNPELIGEVGRAIGVEARNKGGGAQVLLGPAVNIHRTPLGGRNGEYFSEDPFLSARLGVGYIRGMQSSGTAACVKHYIANNQETNRFDVNAVVGERALREIYMPSFKAAVQQGGVWTLMTSYNKINGPYASANWYLDTQVLKNQWGFDGLVMSDWGGVHAVASTLNAGNDLEMPGGQYLKPANVKAALADGDLSPQLIEASARRVIRTIARVGLLDGPIVTDAAQVNSDAHRALAQRVAEQSLILLKNDKSVLPFNRAQIKTLAVIGPRAKTWQLGANGSPTVTPLRSTSAFDGIAQSAGAGVKINYAVGINSLGIGGAAAPVPASALRPEAGGAGAGTPGLRGEYFGNVNLEGTPNLTRADAGLNFDWSSQAPGAGVARTDFSARWTGTLTSPVSGWVTLALVADDGVRLFVDGKQLIDHWVPTALNTQTATLNMVAGRAYDIRIEYYQGGGDAALRFNWILPGDRVVDPLAEAVAAARACDAAVVLVGAGNEGEGQDRATMNLSDEQNELIRAVRRANPRTVVVLNNGTPVTMTPWIADVPALIEAWFPGQEGGAALGRVLFGDVNPSGHLSDTLAAKRTDYSDLPNYPGTDLTEKYDEGIYVGYRHFDKAGIAPLFPFGHGLSYTTFGYSDLKMSPTLSPDGTVSGSLRVTNTGQVAGAEVVQLYVHDMAPKIDRAPRELKGFARVELGPGQSETVNFRLDARALSYCDVPGQQWKANAGAYEVEIGASSRDLRLKAPLRLSADWTEAIPGMGAVSPYAPRPSLSTGKSATASSVTGAAAPKLAFDLDEGTRWESQHGADPQWLAVDLGQSTEIARVKIRWENAYASAYRLDVSDDGQNWRTVYQTQNGDGGVDNVKFAPTQARYVRMWGVKRATEFGYSIYGMDVYGSGE